MCALGHVLHVGSTTIPVHSEQYTTPSLHFKTGNGDIYHVPVTTQWLTGTLHFFDGTTTYSACSGTKTHVGHYWFIGPCLVGADDDVYLESTGTQYIDTGVTELLGTSPFLISTVVATTSNDRFGVLFGKRAVRTAYDDGGSCLRAHHYALHDRLSADRSVFHKETPFTCFFNSIIHFSVISK